MLYSELKAVLDGEPALGMLERSESVAVRSGAGVTVGRHNAA